MKKFLLLPCICIGFAACTNSNTSNSKGELTSEMSSNNEVKNQKITVSIGDLLFIDTDCGPLCDAINAVTPSYNDLPMSHVGFKVKHEDKTYIIDASSDGVQLKSLGEFIRQAKGDVVIGQIKPEYKYLLDSAMAFAVRQLNTPYDDEYLINNGKLYCSELIYESFKYANGGNDFFELKPMTYKKPGTEHFDENWQAYFNKKNQPIPEGKPGCNPGAMSLSDKINIVGTITLGGSL